MTRLLLLSALLLALLAPASPAGTLGLQLSLTTEVSRFEVPAEATTLTAAQRQHAAYLQRGSFVVAVALANHSRDDVRLTYADAASAHARFKFSLRDASGTVLWESHPAEDDPDFAYETSVLLPALSTVRRTIRVPLKTEDGAWLPLGRYTLRAEAGQGEVMSVVPIDVTLLGTGIEGRVYFRELHANGLFDEAVAPQPIRATVSIWEDRDPDATYDHPAFEYTGKTAPDGSFHVKTPAGVFHLEAHSPNIEEPLYFAPIWKTVTVVPGQFAKRNFTILGTRRLP